MNGYTFAVFCVPVMHGLIEACTEEVSSIVGEGHVADSLGVPNVGHSTRFVTDNIEEFYMSFSVA